MTYPTIIDRVVDAIGLQWWHYPRFLTSNPSLPEVSADLLRIQTEIDAINEKLKALGYHQQIRLSPEIAPFPREKVQVEDSEV